MIEPIMYFGIGFLVAALVGLVVVPLVHGRAVRLTMRRLEAATPLSMAEIQADKDQLRAEFAMSTRRLEVSVENLRTKSTSQLAELGKKGDAINRLKIELGEKTATIFALEARDKALRDQLRTTEEEFAVKSSIVQDAQRALSTKEADLAKLIGELDERSSIADAQQADIDALKAQVDTLKDSLRNAGGELTLVEERRNAERLELKAATDELTAERGKVENLGRRVNELEQALVAQTTEAEILGRRAHDLEIRLGEQSRLLNESEFELKQLRSEIGTARKTESDLRTAIIELDGKTNSATARLKSENNQLVTELDRTKEERDRLASELGNLKRETEESWASERVENALLRERINDVAAEVARLASALEGPDSPIDAILAAETARDKTAGIVVAHGSADLAEAAPAGGNLADRIRALQSHASRLPHGDDPKSRN
jgi:predicted  nucleic acid-binding Zn-ribbon protein